MSWPAKPSAARVKLRLVKLPAERALLNANAGIEDGDLARIADLETQYPNLIRVPEKLLDWAFTAFSKDASISARWETIRQRQVGHIKGWKIYEQQLAGAPQVVSVDNAAQLFRLLDLNRIEVALYTRWIDMGPKFIPIEIRRSPLRFTLTEWTTDGAKNTNIPACGVSNVRLWLSTMTRSPESCGACT